MCGLTSKLRYDILPKYVSKFDIACLSETKIVNIPTTEFPGFDIFSMKQKSKVHGLAILVKKGLFPYIKKIEKTKSKCILWIVLGLSPQKIFLIVGAVYIPCRSSIHNDKSDYDIVCEDIVSLYAKYDCQFVLLGDFNSRTGKLDDFLSQNLVRQRFEDLGLETERYNCDIKVDSNGRSLINMCNDLNFCMLNGRAGQDKKVGQFTCVKSVGQSTVDYAITSSSLFPFISDFWIDEYDCCLSDVHLPVCMKLEIKQEMEKIQVSDQKYENLQFKSTWKTEKNWITRLNFQQIKSLS